MWILCILFLTFNVWADEQTNRASELYNNGQLLFEEGKYEEALLAWKEAYKLTENTVMLKHIARAQEAQGDFKGAIETLYRYRAFAANNEQDALKEWLNALEQQKDIQEQQQKEKAEREKAAEEAKAKQDEEAKAKQDEEAKAKQEASQASIGNPYKIPMIASWGGTIAFGTASAIFTHKAIQSQDTILDYCHETRNYCLEGLSNKAIAKYRNQKLISIIGWSTTAVGIGASSWLTTKHLTVHLEPNGVTLQGEF